MSDLICKKIFSFFFTKHLFKHKTASKSREKPVLCLDVTGNLAKEAILS